MDDLRPDAMRGNGSVGPGFDQTYIGLSSDASGMQPGHDDRTLNDSAPVGRLRRRSSGPQQHHRPKRIACKECRQAKLRCDGLRNGGKSCIRCCRLSLKCEVDSSYKRVNKRRRMNELEEELEQLRSVVGDQNNDNAPPPRLSSQRSHSGHQHQSPESLSSPASAVSSTQQQNNDFQIRRERTISSTVPMPRVWQTMESVSQPSKSAQDGRHISVAASSGRNIEQVELNGSQVDHLFQVFFRHYHPYLEILNASITPDTYYARSPLLFWAIISVAARRYEADATLLGSLNACVTRLLWTSASQLPLPSYTIQAMLLLCMWSFPVDTQWKDSSYLLASLAKSAAMQNGLHRPETMQDFLRVNTKLNSDEFHEAVKLWAGCYITAESVTICAGQPSLFSSDWAIDRACEVGNSYTVPDSLRYYLLIYRFMVRVNKTMMKRTRSPVGQPTEKESDGLMKLLECDFEDLEMQIGDNAGGDHPYPLKVKLAQNCADIHAITLTMACLQLRVYYFFESPVSEIRKQGLLRAYTTTLNLVSRVTDADTKGDFIRYAPNVFSLSLITSGMLLMKIINSSYSRYVDIEGGKLAFNKVLALLRRASLEDNDVRGRGGKILAQLWTVHHSCTVRREQEPSLRVKSRFGVSVLHDGLWTWREEFGGQAGPQSGPLQPISNLNQLTPSTSPDALFQPPQPTINNRDHSPGNDQPRQDMVQPYVPDTNFNNMNNLAADLSNFQDWGWGWGIGFPSLLPIDIDSYPSFPPPLQGGGDVMQ